eukprot:scaffold108912_cov35-Attheya_sp.AAC.3
MRNGSGKNTRRHESSRPLSNWRTEAFKTKGAKIHESPSGMPTDEPPCMARIHDGIYTRHSLLIPKNDITH